MARPGESIAKQSEGRAGKKYLLVGGRVRKSRAVGDPSAPIPEKRMGELGRISGNSQTILSSSLGPSPHKKAARLNPELHESKDPSLTVRVPDAPGLARSPLSHFTFRPLPEPDDIVLVLDPDQRADDQRKDKKLLSLFIHDRHDRKAPKGRQRATG
jgi:hypothetical protein